MFNDFAFIGCIAIHRQPVGGAGFPQLTSRHMITSEEINNGLPPVLHAQTAPENREPGILWNNSATFRCTNVILGSSSPFSVD
jgi:hypothetical protein